MPTSGKPKRRRICFRGAATANHRQRRSKITRNVRSVVMSGKPRRGGMRVRAQRVGSPSERRGVVLRRAANGTANAVTQSASCGNAGVQPQKWRMPGMSVVGEKRNLNEEPASRTREEEGGKGRSRKKREGNTSQNQYQNRKPVRARQEQEGHGRMAGGGGGGEGNKECQQPTAALQPVPLSPACRVEARVGLGTPGAPGQTTPAPACPPVRL